MSVRGLVTSLLSALLLPSGVAACTCMPPPPCEAFEHADAVFTGRAEVRSGDEDRQRTSVHVEQIFKGPATAQFELETQGFGFSCDMEFTDGIEYFVYAERRGGAWTASSCAVKRLAGAAADLENARVMLMTPPGTTTIVGRVCAALEPEGCPVVRCAAVEGALVTARGQGQARSERSDAQGRFMFLGMPYGPHEFDVSAADGRHSPTMQLDITACILSTGSQWMPEWVIVLPPSPRPELDACGNDPCIGGALQFMVPEPPDDRVRHAGH